jgi:hypothetical protein
MARVTAVQAGLVDWLDSPENPPVRYRLAREVTGASDLTARRRAALDWGPVLQILALQRPDGGFGRLARPDDARATIWALVLLERCGFELTDDPIDRAVRYLQADHVVDGAFSYLPGATGVLPCYLGTLTTALLRMGGLDLPIVQGSLRWLVDHQRFDHREIRSGGTETWANRAPANYGCWQAVSCFHGVAGAFRAFASVPVHRRDEGVSARLEEAVAHLRIRRLFRRTRSDRPLFAHLTTPFLVGDYRADLLDLLHGVADADPSLASEGWVGEAIADMTALAPDGRVPLVRNYGKRLASPIPLEPVGSDSRFLSLEWLEVRHALTEG